MADAGDFEVWDVGGEQPPAPPDGMDGGGFEVWAAMGELPPVMSLAGAGGVVEAGRQTVIVGSRRSIYPSMRRAG